MNILLTNDDGYQAKGIIFLKDYFKKKGHSVFTVAPDREKSGASHSITLRDTIRLIKEKDNEWVIRGTPADCVILGLLGLVPEKINIVISGVNHGPNIGRDIIYSGTAAGARQGGLSGIPSIALSVNAWKGDFYLDSVEDFLDKYFEKLINSSGKNFFYNINFPNLPLNKIKGIQKTIPCHKHYYQDELVHFDSPIQGRYYWVNGRSPAFELEDGTDAKAIKNGFISVSPVKIFPEAMKIDFDFI
ncbi:MAG: 5'/3'-nucleotidase SurE [Spirochaetes bacterium]|nr:5'/3'-nucleotidase SurE [Spirochaetota bacterium]